MITGAPSSLRFAVEWQPGDDVQAMELAATWASLQIWSGGECVTTVEDLQTGSARRSIYCSLYPLAEWIAFNWWYLLADQRSANLLPDAPAGYPLERHVGDDLVEHHLLSSVGDGFLFPRLAVIPEGATTRLSWRADTEATAKAPIRFISFGDAVVDSEEVRIGLGDLVEAVVTRLNEQGVHETALEREWLALQGVDAEEREFCVASARLGLDAYCLDPRIASVIQKADELLEPATRDELLDAAEPSAAALASALVWVKRGLGRIDKWHGGPSSRLNNLRKACVGTGVSTPTAWARGYEQARQVRAALELPAGEHFDSGEFLASGRGAVPGRGFQGMGGMSPKGAPALILSDEMRAPSARFAEARALWHFVYGSRESHFLLTLAHGDRQRAERAFAAELLAPAAGVMEQLDGERAIVSVDEVEAVAGHFRVSPMVIDHQLSNHLGATVV